MIQLRHLHLLTVCSLTLCLPASGTARAAAQGADVAETQLAGEIELARLIDLCAARLGLNIEYDASVLRGTVTLRLGSAVSNEQLWALTNQLLVSRGFATVRMPGDDVLSVVRLTDAAGIAQLQRQQRTDSVAGSSTVLTRTRHRTAKDIAEVVKPLLSRPGGSVTALDDEQHILVSDVRSRLDFILQLIEQLDVPGPPTIVRQVPSRFLDATQLASVATAAATARNAIDVRPLKGRLTPVPDGNAVVLIAPQDEVPLWVDLIDRFDQRQAVDTRSYTPIHFGIREVAQLLEQTARDPGPRGSGDRWRLVSDELTGTLIVTATPAEHEKIEALIQRLDLVPVEARRPVRAFPIRNRSVHEIVEVLTRLIEGGALESGGLQPTPPGPEKARPRQRTERQVLPPGAERVLPAEAPGRGPDLSASPRARYRTGGGQESLLTLTADEGTNTLIAIGDARRLAQLEELIQTLDIRQPQVMLEVLVVSLTDNDTLDLVIELE